MSLRCMNFDNVCLCRATVFRWCSDEHDRRSRANGHSAM